MKQLSFAAAALIVLAPLGSAFAADNTHVQHAHHDHVHGASCGHKAEKHGDHTDYEDAGHHHKQHGDHWDECTGPEGDATKQK